MININIDTTLIRVKGQGLLIKRPKTKSSIRVLRVPLWLVAILRDRRARDPESQGAVFPDSFGGHGDPNNVERDTVGFGGPFEGVMPYTYRKTVATMLDRQGLSARNIADQLGHARISMTQDVYMCRPTVDQAAAAVLEGISPPGHDGDDKPPAVSGSRPISGMRIFLAVKWDSKITEFEIKGFTGSRL